jgi:uncharacterized protein YwqG
VSVPTDRRSFFGDFVREVVGVVRDVNEAIRLGLEPAPIDDAETWPESPPVRAESALRSVSSEALLALCRQVGLENRSGQVLRLLRPSLRLTRTEAAREGAGSSRLGGIPDLPPGFEWPCWQGEELAFLGQVNLGEVAVLCSEGDLPPRGLLLFFYETRTRPSGLEPADRGSCRVLHANVDAESLRPDPEGRAWFPEYPLELSLELMLPRSWSQQIDPLDLTAAELVAWDELREELARAQGVELEELTPTWQALHRLVGYPEELGSDIELECQLVSSGLNLRESEGYSDPRRDELEAGAEDWRLLLQLSDDPELAASWGEGFSRLYFWIRGRDLRSHAFDGVWAILR